MRVKLNQNVTAIIAELPVANSKRLRELWVDHIGRSASMKLRPSMMRPVLAYRIQERAYGGLRPDLERQLREVLKSLKPGGRCTGEAHTRFKAGTRIVREWQGKRYEVTITSEGYQYEGEIYKSLSPIANLITGSRWSGPAFFGTKLKAAR